MAIWAKVIFPWNVPKRQSDPIMKEQSRPTAKPVNVSAQRYLLSEVTNISLTSNLQTEEQS